VTARAGRHSGSARHDAGAGGPADTILDGLRYVAPHTEIIVLSLRNPRYVVAPTSDALLGQASTAIAEYALRCERSAILLTVLLRGRQYVKWSHFWHHTGGDGGQARPRRVRRCRGVRDEG